MDEKGHRIQLVAREQGVITGVIDVINFDLGEIVLKTTMGTLVIKGKDMHVKRLSLEKGEIELEGNVESIVYSEKHKGKKENESLMGRLFG